jgi:hypothetical protein
MQPVCCDTRNWNSIQLRVYPIADCTHGSMCAVSQKCQVIETIEDALKDSATMFLDNVPGCYPTK